MTRGCTPPDPPRASASAAGTSRATGEEDLEHLVRWGRGRAAARVLDMVTGDGRAALGFTGFTPTVVAADTRASVLRATRQCVANYGFGGLRVLAADPLALPFRDESFGVVICRSAAHRFPELLPALRQVARVLRRGGSFLLADLLGHEDAEIARFVQELETARDPAHVRAFRPIEWAAFLRAAGLSVIDETQIEAVRVWDEWAARASEDARAALDRVVRAAPARCRDALRFTLEGDRIRSFTAPMLLLRADKD